MSFSRRNTAPRRARHLLAAIVAAAMLVLGLALPVGAVQGPTKLFDVAVTPRTGTPTTTITFTAEYRNREGSAADWVRVVIDGTAHEMASDGGTDWKNGVGHSYTTTLGVGVHEIRFEAADTRKFTDSVDGGAVTIALPPTPPPPPPTPSPDPTPPPTPAPTPAPTPDSTPAPKPTPTPSGDPGPNPNPTPDPTTAPGATGAPGDGTTTDGSDGSGADPSDDPGWVGPGGGFGGSGSDGSGPGDAGPGRSGPDGAGVHAGHPGDDPSAGGAPGAGAGPGSGGTSTGGTGATGGGSGDAAGGGSGSAGWGALATALEVLGLDDSAPGLRLLPTLVGTSGAVAMALAFAIFGKKRRDEDPPAPDEVLYAHAARGTGVAATAEFTHGVVAQGAIPPPFDVEASMPRWRRPSLLEARKADPTRTVVTAPRLSFDDGRVSPVEGHERRIIRYRVVRLLDAPDELRSVDIGQLDQGDEVQLLEKSGAYWLVLCPDGRQGWLHKMTLGEVVSDVQIMSPQDAWDDTDMGTDVLSAYLAARAQA